MELALVDIETTGGYTKGNGITEIAILIVREGEIVQRFHQLINPERSVPEAITAITGISDITVQGAVSFSAVAKEITALLHGRIFAAHNVNFDYAFLKDHLGRCGYTFQARRFCSLRYAKMVKPGLQSYSLSNLCRVLHIDNPQKHRAMGDALATFQLINLLRTEDREGHFENLLRYGGHKSIIPSHISEAEILDLPEQPGVYYLLDRHQKPVYIGKAKNLRKRVLSHFTSITKSRRRQIYQKEIWRVTCKTTLTEAQALLLEDREIKHYWPKYNKAQKNLTRPYMVVVYYNRAGEGRLAIVQQVQGPDVLARFDSLSGARQWLNQAVIRGGFNPERAGLSHFSHSVPSNDTQLFDQFVKEIRRECRGTFLLLEEAVGNRRPFLMIENETCTGFADFPADTNDPWQYAQSIQPVKDSPENRALVKRLMLLGNIEILQKA